MVTTVEITQQYPGLTLSVWVATGLLVFILISIIIYRFFDKKHLFKVKSSINPTRIYVVDYANDRSIFFDKSKFSRRIEGSKELFFHQFENNAVEGIRNWLENLLVDENTPLFFEADVNVAKLKSTFFSLLQVLKVDRTKKIIYLESYLFKNLRPAHQINKKLEKRNRYYFRSYEKVSPLYKKARARNRGILLMIRFFKIQNFKESNIDLEKLINIKLKDHLTLFLSPSRVMFDYDDLHVGFFDAKAKKINGTSQIANSIQQSLRSFMKLNGIEGYSFSIGAAEARLFPSFEVNIDVAKASAFIAETRKQLIIYHDSQQPEISLTSDYFRAELERFIKENKTSINFRPIVYVDDARITGYLSYVNPFQSAFSSYKEMLSYAIKSGRDRELFSVIVKRITSTFYNQGYDPNEDYHLFLPAQLINRETIIRDLKKISHVPELKLVFVFEATDIEGSIARVEEVKKTLEDIKKIDFEVAIILTNTELTISDQIYRLFDYFIVDDTLLKNTYQNERNRLYLLSALGKLLRYKKPIILSDLPTWSDIEYFIRAGIDYVSSNQISEKSSMFPKVEKKKLQKIKSLSRKK